MAEFIGRPNLPTGLAEMAAKLRAMVGEELGQGIAAIGKGLGQRASNQREMEEGRLARFSSIIGKLASEDRLQPVQQPAVDMGAILPKLQSIMGTGAGIGARPKGIPGTESGGKLTTDDIWAAMGNQGPAPIKTAVITPKEEESPKNIDGILAQRVLSNEMTIEDAFKLKASVVSANQPKPPTGFRILPSGNLEAIPGGPAAIKEELRADRFVSAKQAYMNKADIVMVAIDSAMSLIGETTTGLGASFASIPRTDAKNLSGYLTTIKANIGFQELNDMRQNSRTGGALGNVSDKETELLQAVGGSLDQKQSPSQLRKNLLVIKASTQRMRDAAEQDARAGHEESARGKPPSKPEAKPDKSEGVSGMTDQDILKGLIQ